MNRTPVAALVAMLVAGCSAPPGDAEDVSSSSQSLMAGRPTVNGGTPSCQATSNLVKNGGFDTGDLTSWTRYWSTADLGVTSEASATGPFSLKVVAPVTTFAKIQQPVSIPSNVSSVTLSASIWLDSLVSNDWQGYEEVEIRITDSVGYTQCASISYPGWPESWQGSDYVGPDHFVRRSLDATACRGWNGYLSIKVIGGPPHLNRTAYFYVDDVAITVPNLDCVL